MTDDGSWCTFDEDKEGLLRCTYTIGLCKGQIVNGQAGQEFGDPFY